MNDYRSPVFKQAFKDSYIDEELKLHEGSPNARTRTPVKKQNDGPPDARFQIKSNIPRLIKQPNLENNRQREKLKTAKKLQQGVHSPIKYMTQTNIKMVPFEIKEMACPNEDAEDNPLNLCANDGGEIDIK